MTFALPTTEFGGNYANVKMLQSVADALGNTATITSSGRLTTAVTDGAGRVTQCAVSNGMITSITAPGMPAVSYAYTSNRLTSITHEDSEVTTYQYNGNGLLSQVNNHDGTSIVIGYYDDREPYRVKRIEYWANGSAYGGREYEYGDCRTTAYELIPSNSTTLTTGKALIYHFNDAGAVVSVNDELGYGSFAGYSPELPLNHPEYISKMQRCVDNRLLNHCFLNINDDWTADLMDGTGSSGYSSEDNYVGGRAYKLNKTSVGGRISTYQQVYLEKGQAYTLACQYKTTSSAALQFAVTYTNSVGNPQTVESLLNQSSSWERAYLTFTLPSDAQSNTVTLRFMAAGGAGVVRLDAAQLETGEIMNRHNLLQNGSFTMNTSGAPFRWTAGEDNTETDGVYTTATGDRPQGLYGNVLRLYGEPGKIKSFYQGFTCFGNAGDVFTVGGWSMSNTRPSRTESDSLPCEYCMQIRARPFAEGYTPSLETIATIYWSEEWSGWHFAAKPITIPWQYSTVGVRIYYRNSLNYAEFSNIFLHKEEFGKTYTYDDDGNITRVKNTAAADSYATYDDFNNTLTSREPGRPSNVKTVNNYGDTDLQRKKHLLLKTTSPMSVIQTFQYDNKGNNTVAQTEDSTATDFIRGTTAYSGNQNYVASQTDARNKTVTSVTDANKGTLTSVTDPNSQTVSYTYDTLKRVTQASATAGGNTYKNEYVYEDDRLKTVKHNTTSDATCDVAYHFGYDAQGRPTTVKVGAVEATAQTLSTNTYNTTYGSPLYGTLTQTTFGNGDSIRNTYDEFKRVTGVRFDSDASDRYTYDFGANGQVAKVTDTLLNRTAQSEYDVANRPMRVIHKQNGQHLYTGQVAYDAYGNLSQFSEKVGTASTAYATTFGYDNQSRPTTVQYGSASNQTAYTYDDLGRMTTRTLTVGGTNYASTYGFTAGGHGAGSTTALVSSITQNGQNCSYTYDDVGNITSEIRGAYTTTYGYDNLGQLTRVNNQRTNWTLTYEYDRGGNILNEKRYSYTTGVLGAVLETISYTYDAAWNDKLTSYYDMPITYDVNGNVHTYNGWTYTWQCGRQLAGMSRAATIVSFDYNADGLRIRKTVNGTATNYTLHGKQIVHLKKSADNMHFFYDAQGRPSVVDFNGIKYGYVHNLQGDVIALIDGSGSQVVEYTYDAWGKLLTRTGTLAATLGVLNPFRWRGYVYDEETYRYYLRSRYYSPPWHKFLNADSTLGKPGSLLGHNVFAYCKNNPVKMIDPSGEMAYSNDLLHMYIKKEYELEDKEETALENIGKYCYQTAVQKFGITAREVEALEQTVIDVCNSEEIRNIRNWSYSKPGKAITKAGFALYHLVKGTFDFAVGGTLYLMPEIAVTKVAGTLFVTRGVYHYIKYIQGASEAINLIVGGE